MKLPREGDVLLIDIFLRAPMSQDLLLSLQRYRIKWKAMFLSNLVASNGRQTERQFLAMPTVKDGIILSLGFAKESPSPRDWANWAEFWGRFTLPGFYLHAPLGKWISVTHCHWEWFYVDDSDILERQVEGGVEYYLQTGSGRTRAAQEYIKTVTHLDGRAPAGMPGSVVCADYGTTASLVCSGPKLAVDPEQPSSFFAFLKQWGGDWMWSDVTNEGPHMKWVVDAIRNGTAIWVTDESYNRTLAPILAAPAG